MNDLTTSRTYLPETVPELAKFVLIGREKLNSVRAEIRAIQKVGLAKEVLEQKKAEAQELAEAVLDAEVRTGELLKEIPKATNGGANQYSAKSTPLSNEQKPKSEVLKEANIPQKQAERFQFLANHKDEVEKAKEEARRSDRIVTRNDVIQKVSAKQQSLKEMISEEAKAEHDAFNKRKESGETITFDEIKKEKESLEILAFDFATELKKASVKLYDLKLGKGLNGHDISEYYKYIPLETKERIINYLLQNIETSKYFIQELRRNK